MSAFAIFATLVAVGAQQIGINQAETHPPLTWSSCTSSGCTQTAGSITLDANWRWVHGTGSNAFTNCYTDNSWDTALCPDPTTCVKNCAVDGAGSYANTYGITTSGNSLRLNLVTNNGNDFPNVGSRVYLLANTNEYETFTLHNREFTFTVDVSHLDCGLNGAVYFSQMDADGGMSRFPNNKAGAAYGTGYCDSQCPRDLKFINGIANTVNWTASDSVSGTGSMGSCCNEMDIWEANKQDNAVTPHPCSTTQQTACTGSDCVGTLTTGLCDPAGCDFNPYRQGVTGFYGPGKTVDTNSPVTVVTQFITSDGTDNGALTSINRIYIQNGKVIGQPVATNIGLSTNQVSDNFCAAQKKAFGDDNIFAAKGGFKTFGQFSNKMVLVLSLWDDHSANMLWLDSNYPVDRSTSLPGTVRGPCATTSGAPTDVESAQANAFVTYSDIRFGTINSTFTGAGSLPPSNPTTTVSTSPPKTTTSSGGSSGCASQFAQCGGIGFTGPTCCQSGFTCNQLNPYFFQCL